MINTISSVLPRTEAMITGSWLGGGGSAFTETTVGATRYITAPSVHPMLCTRPPEAQRAHVFWPFPCGVWSRSFWWNPEMHTSAWGDSDFGSRRKIPSRQQTPGKCFHATYFLFLCWLLFLVALLHGNTLCTTFANHSQQIKGLSQSHYLSLP